jgi:hypothetical protein
MCSARLLSRLALRGAEATDGSPSPAHEEDGPDGDGPGHDGGDDDDGPRHDDDKASGDDDAPGHDEVGEGHDDEREGCGDDDIDDAHAKAAAMLMKVRTRWLSEGGSFGVRGLGV